MHDGVHVRLMVTRGVKRTPYQDPRVTVGPATIVIIPEFKLAKPETLAQGLTLFTVHVRRGFPDVQDPKLNSHSKLNCITACIQAYTAGADEALMLDPHGFVATCNSRTSSSCAAARCGPAAATTAWAASRAATCCASAREAGIPAREKNFSLTEVYSADEAFVTGTFAGVAPVRSIDGRVIGDALPGPMVQRLQGLYKDLVRARRGGARSGMAAA